MRKKTFARSRNSAHCTLFKLSQGLNKHHHLPSFCHLPTFPDSFPTSPRRSLPFSFRALFEAELQFSELILFWRIIVVLGGEGEVGRLEQVTPCEKGEKVQKKVRKRERARSERWSLRLFGEDGQLTIQREAKIAIFRREIVLVCSLKSLQRFRVRRGFFVLFVLFPPTCDGPSHTEDVSLRAVSEEYG